MEINGGYALNLREARAAFESKNVNMLAEIFDGFQEISSRHTAFDKAHLLINGSPSNILGVVGGYFKESTKEALKIYSQEMVEHPALYRSMDQDYIAQQSGIVEWNVDQTINRLLLERTPYERASAAVVATMRDDGIYILEWIAHYRILGFRHFFVYTNDNADSSDELLMALANAGVITVVINEVTGRVPPEVKAFGHALNLLPTLWKYEWALFVDSDEFLLPPLESGAKISRVLNECADCHKDAGAILYDWRWYVSDMQERREDGLLLERFSYARDHWMGKCIVRLRDVISMRQQHFPDLTEGASLYDSVFQKIDESKYWERDCAQYGGGQINHYWPKSFEEFLVKKARGASFAGEDNPYDRPYSKFFEWNGYAESCSYSPCPERILRAVRAEVDKLIELPGVRDAQAAVESGFRARVDSIASQEDFQELYARSRVPPGPL